MSSTGYLHRLYSQSLKEFGQPIELPVCKGWILKRSISGTSQFDGMGCYPIFTCEDWSNLGNDLDRLSGQLVSLTMVTDPFGNYDHQDLQRSFKNIAKPYKEHFVINLLEKPGEFVDTHHKRNAYKALKNMTVEIDREPIKYLDEWVSLYGTLIERHNIKGISRFSRKSFSVQFSVPGMVVFRAAIDDRVIGMLLWYVQGDIGYYHLGAYSADGYKLNASFALFWTALSYFADAGLHWLSLGAGAGIQGDGNDGLTRFKKGWATGTRTAYFCGRIFDPKKYNEIVSVRNAGDTSFFPAYRAYESE